ncbi:MAG: hypothetical protein CMM81_05380 [Rhodospirillales bacterium]|nr:hypothetical protein [Rhodospirillales bacterium]|tara:strand:+ start:11354 stop:11755 length:402 start_codon:yes stop_codon:yes gene_type:complete
MLPPKRSALYSADSASDCWCEMILFGGMFTMMRFLKTAALVTGLLVGSLTFSGIAVAQSSDDGASLTAPGRYLTMPTTIDGKPGTLMVDTAFGRTWMLVKSDKGAMVWQRVFIDSKSEEVPEGMTRRPSRVKQ